MNAPSDSQSLNRHAAPASTSGPLPLGASSSNSRDVEWMPARTAYSGWAGTGSAAATAAETRIEHARRQRIARAKCTVGASAGATPDREVGDAVGEFPPSAT